MAHNHNPPKLMSLDFDLTLHEARRRVEVIAAIGSLWDPITAIRSEETAYALLYSNLDPDQQRTYDNLVQAGVLPQRDSRP
ncbi:DUF6400 family protein [Kitasatospora indigofera]|uniref:DUF6400 family protein n=1 Tax=Kitasatospora indigofera TaxID=67307 RepID=UPI0036B62FBE